MPIPLKAINYLTAWYSNLYHVPSQSMVIGQKRSAASTAHQAWKLDTIDTVPAYQLPATRGPGKVQRSAPTKAEVLQEIGAIRHQLNNQSQVQQIHSPIMPLSPGHLGMVLASGTLDGIMDLDDGRRVCIRGIARGVQYKASDVTVLSCNSQQKKVTWSECCSLKIRTIDSSGKIEEYKHGQD